MSEDTPQLYLSGTELYQWAQVIVVVSQLSARIRQRREAEGRLAHADDEHAARLGEARAEPAVRPMTDDERQEWLGRIPAELRSQHEESFTVWTAPVGRGWGVEANTWDTATGESTSTLLVFCRDDEDAIDLCRWLRDHHTPDDLARLREMAASSVRGPTPESGQATIPLVLSEDDWEAALRGQLRPRLADKIIVRDPAHPHHTAWRELHALANEEVWRVGAHPAELARIVRNVPVWRENVRKPPALAHWAITEFRASPGYEQTVRPQPATTLSETTNSPSNPADAPFVVEGEVVPAASSPRLRLDQVRGPEAALRWADGLEPGNPEHRIEAKQGLGRLGSRVDTVLSRKFPGLMTATNAAAERQRRREKHGDGHGAVPASADAAAAGADGSVHAVVVDPARTALLLEEVGRLDPQRRGDRLAAFAMFGNVSSPDVDLELARKFGGDERFAQKVAALYPDGLAEIEAAAWRSRAEANEQRGAAHMAVPDDPATPPREDALARGTATSDQQIAAAQRGAATAVTHRPPVVSPAEPNRQRVR